MPRTTPHTTETKIKIGLANRGVWTKFNCDYCGKENEEKQSHFKKNKRHFCNRKCYSDFRRELLPKEEQHAFGTGLSIEERNKRKKTRRILNHAIRDGKIKREPCEVCLDTDIITLKVEGHHYKGYDFPLEVRWLCPTHHREEENENPELLSI